MKITLNITFKTWRTWFELSTVILAFAIMALLSTNKEIDWIVDVSLGLTINWVLSILIGLRKY